MFSLDCATLSSVFEGGRRGREGGTVGKGSLQNTLNVSPGDSTGRTAYLLHLNFTLS